MYLVNYSIQNFKNPSDLLDNHFSNLCLARKANKFNKPIYIKVSNIDSSDETMRFMDKEELCQHCETKLSKIVSQI